VSALAAGFPACVAEEERRLCCLEPAFAQDSEHVLGALLLGQQTQPCKGGQPPWRRQPCRRRSVPHRLHCAPMRNCCAVLHACCAGRYQLLWAGTKRHGRSGGNGH